LLAAKLGRRDLLDRVLEWNAWFAGWVAQKLWTRVLFAIVGIHLRVKQMAPIDWAKTHVVCANHTSIFDILALVRAMPPPFRFVAKRELLKWPIIGWSLRPAGQIVVDRRDRANALRAIAEAAVRKIRGQVIFFVEGTRSRTGELLPFKKGAFHFAQDNQLAILPAAINGSHAALARTNWWHLHPNRSIEVRFCIPIIPESASVDDLLDATRKQIAAALADNPDLRLVDQQVPRRYPHRPQAVGGMH
jgi:1-acyl-sn-glycerol-3-phosphate acyltransferase